MNLLSPFHTHYSWTHPPHRSEISDLWRCIEKVDTFIRTLYYNLKRVRLVDSPTSRAEKCAPTGQAKSKAVLPARGGGLKHCKEACALRLLATSLITAPAQQHVDMDWTWDARPGDGSQNSVQVAGGRYRARPVVDRVNHARPHRRTRGLRDSMVLEGKADLQLPPGRAPSGRAAGSTST